MQNRTRAPVTYAPPSKPILRKLPKEATDVIPTAQQFTDLAEMEAKLDATIARKRFDMQDTLSRPTKIRKTFRIWLSNTVNDQAWQENTMSANLDETSFDFENGAIPAWTLRIEGRIIDGDENVTYPAFTDLFKSVLVVETNPIRGLSEGPILDYTRPSGPNQSIPSRPGIEVKRKGDSDVQLSIALTLLNSPEKYKIPESYADIVDDTSSVTRHDIITSLWRYIKAEKLQDTEDRRLIHADAVLRELFGLERIFFPDLPKLIIKHLLPVDPIILTYTVNTAAEVSYSKDLYDIEIDIPDPFNSSVESMLKSVSTPNAKIAEVSQSISDCILSIENSLSKRAFLMQYAENPVETINAFIVSQARDLEIISGDVVRVSGEDARRASFWKGSEAWLKESMSHYLSERNTLYQQG